MYVLNIYTNKHIYIFVCVAINFEYRSRTSLMHFSIENQIQI
jgi:hypothetical protein